VVGYRLVMYGLIKYAECSCDLGGVVGSQNLESIIRELQEQGAHILDIKSKAAKVGQPPMTVNTVTITYKTPKRIKLEG